MGSCCQGRADDGKDTPRHKRVSLTKEQMVRLKKEREEEAREYIYETFAEFDSKKRGSIDR